MAVEVRRTVESVPLTEAGCAAFIDLLRSETARASELPDDREGRFWPFCLGAVIFAAVLIVIAAKIVSGVVGRSVEHRPAEAIRCHRQPAGRLRNPRG